MSVRWDGTSGDKATTAAVGALTIDTSCAYSACGWVSSNNGAGTLAGVTINLYDSVNNKQFSIKKRAASDAINAFGYGAGPYFTNLTTPDDDSWFFWAVSVSGTAIGSATLYTYIPGTGWASSTNSLALQQVLTPSQLWMGGGPSAGAEEWIGKHLGNRVWNAVLTQAEFEQEMRSIAPRRLANLHAAIPLIGPDSDSAFRDLCGNSWTLTGTITYDDTVPPNVGYGAPIPISSTELASRDQEGFRFGVDDDIESAHTWAAAQDANLTAPLDTNTLLRVLVDGTDDPASAAYTLRYQKGGAGGYVAVPVGASVTTSPPQVTSATVQSITSSSSSWALTNGRPAASAGDMIIAVVAWDDSTTVSSVTPPAGPNSESAVSIAGPQYSAQTEMRMQAWYWIATGSWTLGNWTYTPSASETCRQAAFVIPAGQFNASDPIGWANTRASTGTAESTLNSPTGTAEANDGSGRLFIAYGSDAAAITAPASGTTTVSNGTTGGVGLCIVSRDTVVANSESIAAISATITSDSWAALGFVVKPKVVTNEVYVSASANIAAGGEATTARLTAPSGKTTSDFVTGRRWDDENGTDTIDITADDYTELEWCLKAQSPAVATDYFEFRVYAGLDALDTYTVTPKWTIGTTSVTITPGSGSVAISGVAPTVVTTANKVVDVPKGTLSLTSFVPSVAVSDHKLVNVPQGSLLLFGLAPTVAATAHVTVSVPADALSLSTFVPTVTATGNVLISVPLATLSLAATAPLVLTGASQIVQVPKGTLTLAAEAPTVATTANQVVSVPKADLTLTSYEPSVVATANQKVDVPAASLELTGYAPTVSADGGTIVSVPFSSLELTLHAPTIVTPRVVSIPEAVLELVAYEPTIITPRLIDVPSTSLTLTSFAPEVHTTAVIEVPATSLTITGYAPSVDAGSGGGVASTRVTWG